jgi:succinate dehydrogenase/fumarate reductase flavoprotein subunit
LPPIPSPPATEFDRAIGDEVLGLTTAAETQLFQRISVSRVILACGGFERNEQMRVKYQRAPITTEWTVGAKANTGDGIIAAEKLGAALDIMEDAWWGPTVPLVGAPLVRAVGTQLPRLDHREHGR